MPSLPIVITGTGRSGTTFLTHTFAKAGYDVGDVPLHLIGHGKRASGGGLEWTRFSQLNQKIFHKLGKGEHPMDIANEIRPEIPEHFPQVIKHPLYIFTFHVWELAGYIPEHIFLCMRNPDATKLSFRKAFTDKVYIERHLCAAYALQAHSLQRGTPITPVVYPRIGQDAEYANTTLHPFIKNASDIIQTIWDTSLHTCTESTQTVLQQQTINIE